MEFIATARQIVCDIIAAVLSMTVAAADALLSSRPDLIERVNQLAIQLRENAGGSQLRMPRRAAEPGPDDPDLDDPDDEIEIDTERLLLAYNQLWEFVHDLRSEGVSLDESFCERIEREWSVTTLLTYFRNVDRGLQESAEKTLETAAAHLRGEG